MRRQALFLAALLFLLPACQSPEQQAREELQEQVAGVREAAEGRDVVTAGQRLTALRASVARMSQEDLITEQQTQRILTAALQVQANLVWLATEAPPAAAPAPPPPPPAQLQPPSSNAGGSIDGRDGEPGQRGEDGEDGEDGNDGQKKGKGEGKGKEDD